METGTWSTILYLVVIPVLLQLFKLYEDKTGKTLGKLANQAISLAVALVFSVLMGGFAGLVFPAFPLWQGDLIAFIGGLLEFISISLGVVTVAWGSLMALYEAVWDKLFIKVGFVTKDKLLNR